MKTNYFAAILGAVIIVTGCVSTQNGKTKAGNPFVNDKVEGRYERSPDQVYEAAKAVLMFNGVLLNETTRSSGSNTFRALEGKVNQRSVWIKVQEVDPKVTSVIVQARTKHGGRDLDLVHELDEQIALKLAR